MVWRMSIYTEHFLNQQFCHLFSWWQLKQGQESSKLAKPVYYGEVNRFFQQKQAGQSQSSVLGVTMGVGVQADGVADQHVAEL